MDAVTGHAGKLLFGFLGSGEGPIVLMLGRIQSVLSPVSYARYLGIHSW